MERNAEICVEISCWKQVVRALRANPLSLWIEAFKLVKVTITALKRPSG